MFFEMMRINDVDKFLGREDTIIVDLRSRAEYENGHIPGAVNIPYEQGDNIAVFVHGYNFILLYCQRGSISLMAARDLYGITGRVYSLCGGLRSYYGKLVRI